MSDAHTASAVDAPSVETRRDARRPPSLDELCRFVAEALARPTTRVGLETLVLPLALPIDSVGLLSELRGVDAWYLKRPKGSEKDLTRELIGLGAVRRCIASGKDRFAELERVSRAWLDDLVVTRHPAASPVPPRVFLGFAFAPGAADQEPWEPFGDALAILPRWSIAIGADGTGTLQLTFDRRATTGLSSEVVVAEIRELFGARAPRRPPVARELRVDHEPSDDHRVRVEAVLSEIASGAVEKVVVARRSVVFSDHDFDPVHAVERLLEREAEGTVYFVRRGGSVLLGVTPERLFSLRGSSLETDALAGTARVAEHAVLFASDKDRQEQRLVVTSIENALRPLSSEVRVGVAPELASAGSVVHLRTRISATLRPDVRALEVAAALHPTAAVAGTPRASAVQWISSHEARGWYASPIGWVDQRGDSELFVALRGGVVRGAQAWAFSGGGIVRGSVPAAELDETVLKMGGFLRSLGVP